MENKNIYCSFFVASSSKDKNVSFHVEHFIHFSYSTTNKIILRIWPPLRRTVIQFFMFNSNSKSNENKMILNLIEKIIRNLFCKFSNFSLKLVHFPTQREIILLKLLQKTSNQYNVLCFDFKFDKKSIFSR